MQKENNLLNEETRIKLAIMRIEANSVYGADGQIRGPQEYYESGAFLMDIKDRRRRLKNNE